MGKLLWKLRCGDRPYPTMKYLEAIALADNEAYRRGITSVDAILLLYISTCRMSFPLYDMLNDQANIEAFCRAISELIDMECTPDASRRSTQSSAITHDTEVILQRAERKAVESGCDEVRLEHLLLSVLDDRTVQNFMNLRGIDIEQWSTHLATLGT